MFQSRLSTILVPTVPPGPPAGVDPPKPAVVIERAAVNLVVKVRNNSFGGYVLFALDDQTLMRGGTNPNTFRLPAGMDWTFTLAVGQSLYVATPAAPPDNEISVHIFEAVLVEEDRR